MTKLSPKSPAIAGDLYDLLTAKLPLCVGDGTLKVAKLADELSMSHEGVYKWLRAGEVSKRGRKRLLELANRVENKSLLGPDQDVLTEDDLRAFS